MNREFRAFVDRDPEGFYGATVPGVPGCHTQACSLDESMSRVKEAIEVWVEAEEGTPATLVFRGEKETAPASPGAHGRPSADSILA